MNWGTTTLSGSSCQVRLAERPAESPPESQAKAPRAIEAATPVVIETTGPATLRKAIALRLAAHYSVEPTDLRLTFRREHVDATHPNDEHTLDSLVGARRVQIDPAGGPRSARLPLSITVYESDRVVLVLRPMVDVQIATDVVVARRSLDRGQTVSSDDLTVERRWGSPDDRPNPAIESLVGGVTSARVAAGAPITPGVIQAPLIVKRGDIISVHCLSGSVGVRIKARALGSARDGELVKLQADGSTAVFTARMSGQGRAVVLADASPSSATQETAR